MRPAEHRTLERHPDVPFDLFQIGDAEPGAIAAAGPEPPLLAAAPDAIERDQARRLDPGRAVTDGPEPPPQWRSHAVPFGIVGSLALHLLPFALLLSWHSKTMELPAPIPIRLVIEKPPPEPGKKPLPPARRASEDIGEKVPKPSRFSDRPAPPPATTETETAAMAPPPQPAPPAPRPAPPETDKAAVPPPLSAPDAQAALIAPPPEKPAAPVRKVALRHPPKPSWPLPVPRLAERISAPRHAGPAAQGMPHAGEVPGPAAIRDEYLAYLRVLTLRYLRTVSPGFIAGRSGSMALTIRVLGDGTIARIALASGSGYADIDSRFEQIIGGMGHFPPLPPSYPGDSADLTLRLRFPDALE